MEYIRADGPSALQRLVNRLMPVTTPVHVSSYRMLGGRLVNWSTVGAPVLLLTTVGRRSGRRRTVAIGYHEDETARFVAGINGGLPDEPSWSLNVRADPSVEVQVGRDRYQVHAELLDGEGREASWLAFTTAKPDYARAEAWSGRTIPLFRLPKPG